MSTIENSTSWDYAPYEFCRQAKITPNRLAYDKDRATLIGIVKRSRSGEDYALSKGLLDLLIRLLGLGKRKNGSPVQSAIVVLMDGDKIVEQLTAEEQRTSFGISVQKKASSALTGGSSLLPPLTIRYGAEVIKGPTIKDGAATVWPPFSLSLLRCQRSRRPMTSCHPQQQDLSCAEKLATRFSERSLPPRRRTRICNRRPRTKR